MCSNESHLEKLKEDVDSFNKWREENPDIKISIHNINLSPPSLLYVNLSGVNLSGVNLSNSKFFKSDLSDASLANADLSGAELFKTKLMRADLSGANLAGAFLARANLSGADLSNADLSNADLAYANLTGANLTGANLSEANLGGSDFKDSTLLQVDFTHVRLDKVKINLTGANYLSEINFKGRDLSLARFDSRMKLTGVRFNPAEGSSRKKHYKGFRLGVNGIFNTKNRTIALARQIPEPDSMMSNNPSAVVESLKRARYFLTSSLTMIAIVVLLTFSGTQDSFKLYEVTIPQNLVRLVAMTVSLGALAMCASFLNDGLKGTRFINTQEGAMTVGNFPWMISKYAGTGNWQKMYSKIIRAIMIFHPLVYIISLLELSTKEYIFYIHLIFIVLMLIFSSIIFYLSQKFQYPILFDPEAEKNRKTDVEKQTEVIKEMFEKLISSIDKDTDKEEN